MNWESFGSWGCCRASMTLRSRLRDLHRVPPAFAFGNVGRNTVVGPGLQTLDLAMAREFNTTEGTKFQFRAEFFNALNHTNLGTPGRFVNTPQFGIITEAATPGRQIQFSARVSF